MPFRVVPNILDLLNELKQLGFTIYGASMEGESLRSFKADGEKIVLVLGSEGEGISKRAKSKIDRTLSIEMERDFDSLNLEEVSRNINI